MKYNYIDLGLLSIKNADLPLKLRRSTKHTVVKKHKKILGKSISERPTHILIHHLKKAQMSVIMG